MTDINDPQDQAEEARVIVRGGGLIFLTNDPFLRRAVERCGELERENIALRHELTARYRTLRRDVSQIKQVLIRKVAT